MLCLYCASRRPNLSKTCDWKKQKKWREWKHRRERRGSRPSLPISSHHKSLKPSPYLLQKRERKHLNQEEKPIYAVGHLALGYLSGKATSKLLNVNVNLPLLFLVSIIPDIDLLIPGIEHRGPTHSLIVSFLIFIPLVTHYGEKAVPYFVALTQHSLVGDYLTGRGIQLLWPLNTVHYYGLAIGVTSLVNILLEWIFFLICFTVLLKTKDAWTLLQPHLSNQALSIPVFTVLLPTFLSFPLQVPLQLVIPHLTYLTLFTISILTDFKALLEKQ